MRGFAHFAIACLCAWASFAHKSFAQGDFQNFADFRSALLNHIGAATQRIFLATDFLSDGEIVQALYVAQYRKVNVQVVLGRARANAYMSRLSYLKNQNIPVSLRPAQFAKGQATVLLADEQLYLINGDLDFMAKNRAYHMRQADESEKAALLPEIQKTIATPVDIKAQSLPLVGKQSGQGRIYQPAPTPSRPATPASDAAPADDDGVYDYSRESHSRPDGVATKLPKVTIWQERARANEGRPKREPAKTQQTPRGDDTIEFKPE